jgi:hypothetical protein
MKLHKFTVRLDDDALAVLKAQAALRDVPLETLLNQAVTAGLFFKGLITLHREANRRGTSE